MANENEVVEEKSAKKSSKALPGLVFLIGLALIVGGVLMQVGWFGGNDTPTPETEATETAEETEESTTDEETAPPEDDEGTADASEVDFSVHDIEDNVAIPVKSGENYTYAGSFAMIISEFSVKCDDSGTCGQDGDKVVLKFSTADGKDYTVTLTPSESTQNLIDVPVSVEEWHEDYVVIQLTRE